MLCGIYYGSMYGGTITSVLINTPGESATVVTTLDGYQMARQGRAGAALGVATGGSFFAGTRRHGRADARRADAGARGARLRAAGILRAPCWAWRF